MHDDDVLRSPKYSGELKHGELLTPDIMCNAERVASVCIYAAAGGSQEVADANAQRIVIAVNNFDALLDACKMARDTLDSNCDCNEPEDLDSAFQACFEAVANAECESK